MKITIEYLQQSTEGFRYFREIEATREMETYYEIIYTG